MALGSPAKNVKDFRWCRLVWGGARLEQWRFSFMRRSSSAPQVIYDWVAQLGPVEIRRWRRS